MADNRRVPKPTGEPTADEAKALAHPLRRALLIEYRLGVRSPSSLAQQLDEPLGNVSYHTKTLLSLKMIELVKTEPRRGAVEHYYRAVGGPRDAEVLDQVAKLLRQRSGKETPEDLYAWIEKIEAAVEESGRSAEFDADEKGSPDA